jgi:hypothetical protein
MAKKPRRVISAGGNILAMSLATQPASQGRRDIVVVAALPRPSPRLAAKLCPALRCGATHAPQQTPCADLMIYSTTSSASESRLSEILYDARNRLLHMLGRTRNIHKVAEVASEHASVDPAQDTSE